MRIMQIALLALLVVLPLSVPAKSFGESRPGNIETLSVSAAVDRPEDAGRLAIEGRITQVCQKKGCWVVLAQDEAMIRVMARDHGFFLPKDASGRAIAHGRIERRTLSAGQVEHMVEEDGADAGLRENPVEVRLVADGVELVDP